MEFKPRGQRPKCLYCQKELIPIYKWADEYWNLPFAEKEAWKKANPKVFTGNYGGYGDNRFCGLNCGYGYAIRITGGRSNS